MDKLLVLFFAGAFTYLYLYFNASPDISALHVEPASIKASSIWPNFR